MGCVAREALYLIMTLIANRQLYRDRVLLREGQHFDAPDNEARDLMYRGLARPYYEATGTYETKVIIPAPPPMPVVIPESFRHLYMPDGEQPERVSADGHRVVPDADVEPEGTPDPPRRRRGRPRKVRAE